MLLPFPRVFQSLSKSLGPFFASACPKNLLACNSCRKALFTAETKENVSVPSGSDFAPTPKGAWGAALIVEEKKLPKPHAVSQRAATRKQGRDQALPSAGEWAGCDSPAVEQHGRSAPDRSSPQHPPLAPEAHAVAQGCDDVAHLPKHRRTSTGFGHAGAAYAPALS